MPVAETLSLMVIAPLPPPWIYMAFAPLPSVSMEPVCMAYGDTCNAACRMDAMG